MRWSPAASTGSLTYGYTVHPLAACIQPWPPAIPTRCIQAPCGHSYRHHGSVLFVGAPPPKKIGPRFQFTLYIFLWLWMVGRQPNFFEMQAFWNHFLQCRLPPAGLPYHELSPSHESESPPLLSLSRKQRAAGADAQAESTIQVDRARLPGVGRTVTREP